MTLRERVLAVLSYENCDRLPLVHFGFWSTWNSVLYRWSDEGHIDLESAQNWADGNTHDLKIAAKLGFDFNWQAMLNPATDLYPSFEPKVIEVFADGGRKVLNSYGAIVLEKDGAGSIPMEFDHVLKGRKEWEEEYLQRLKFSPQRIEEAMVPTPDGLVRYDKGGLEYLRRKDREHPCGLHCGSLYGNIRSWLGLVGVSYLMVDDEELFDEIIQTVGDLCFRCTHYALSGGALFDYGHFWEDICFKNGPLIAPAVFRSKIGPQYRRITDLLKEHEVQIVSLDCDGWIDSLISTWVDNGVNTMFPIEVGTWNGSIGPWRETHGRQVLGVGGMNKHIFARDPDAVDQEIQRLEPLIKLGGYLPCPDHRIADDAQWENVKYYCARMREMSASTG